MSDKHLPVATFGDLQEAQLAVNLLRAQGITAMLEGEQFGGGVFPGLAGMGDQIRVLVPEADAPRAATLIGDAQAGTLDEDWEDQAEATAVCTLCGVPIAEGEAACPACATPRDAITAKRPDGGRP